MNEQNQDHLIRRQVFEVDVGNKADAHSWQQSVSELFHSKLKAVTEEILDAYDIPGHVIRIDKLELELGYVDPDQFETEFIFAYTRALREAVRNEVRAIPIYQLPGVSYPSSKLSLEERQTEILLHFLEFGQLPSGLLSLSSSISDLFTQLAQKRGPALAKALKTLYSSSGLVAARLSKQLNETAKRALFNLLAPNRGVEVMDFMVSTTRKVRGQGLSSTSADAESLVSEAVLEFLLDSDVLALNLKQLERNVGSFLAFKLGSPVEGIAVREADEVELASQDSEAARPDDTLSEGETLIALMEAYFLDGTLPGEGVFAGKPIDDLFSYLYSRFRRALQALLVRLKPSLDFYSRLVSDFSESHTLTVFRFQRPRFSAVLLEAYTFLGKELVRMKGGRPMVIPERKALLTLLSRAMIQFPSDQVQPGEVRSFLAEQLPSTSIATSSVRESLAESMAGFSLSGARVDEPVSEVADDVEERPAPPTEADMIRALLLELSIEGEDEFWRSRSFPAIFESWIRLRPTSLLELLRSIRQSAGGKGEAPIRKLIGLLGVPSIRKLIVLLQKGAEPVVMAVYKLLEEAYPRAPGEGVPRFFREIFFFHFVQYFLGNRKSSFDFDDFKVFLVKAMEKEAAVPTAVKRVLQSLVQDDIGALTPSSWQRPEERTEDEPSSTPVAKMDYVRYFLAFGEIPWWADELEVNEIEPIVSELLGRRSQLIPELFESLFLPGRSESEIRALAGRITEQLSDQTLQELIQSLIPDVAGFFMLLGPALELYYRKRQAELETFGFSSPGDFKWQLLFEALVQYGKDDLPAAVILRLVVYRFVRATGRSPGVFIQDFLSVIQATVEGGVRRNRPLVSLLRAEYGGLQPDDQFTPVQLGSILVDAAGAEEVDADVDVGADVDAEADVNVGADVDSGAEVRTVDGDLAAGKDVASGDVVAGGDDSLSAEEVPAEDTPSEVDAAEDAGAELVSDDAATGEIPVDPVAPDEAPDLASPDSEAAEVGADDAASEAGAALEAGVPPAADDSDSAVSLPSDEVEASSPDAAGDLAAPSTGAPDESKSEEDRGRSDASGADLSQAGEEPASDSLAEPDALDFDRDAAVKIFTWFLRHGSMPSEASRLDQASFMALISTLLADPGSDLRPLLQSYVQDRDARIRISRSFSESLFRSLVSVFSPGDASGLLAFMTDAAAVFSQSKAPVEPLWLRAHLLFFLVSKPEGPPDAFDYLQGLFRYLARQHGLPIKELFVYFSDVIEQAGGASFSALRGAIPAFTSWVESLKPPVRRSPDEEKKAKVMDEAMYIKNAGLVLVYPFFPHYFSTLDMLEMPLRKKFKTVDLAGRGVHLLQYIVNKTTETPEYDLSLNKILVGLEIGMTIGSSIEITDAERDLSEELLRVAISQWPTVKNSTPDGFRGSWLLRDGRLKERDGNWTLRVEQKGYDLLLDDLPWSISTVRVSWMDTILNVEWR